MKRKLKTGNSYFKTRHQGGSLKRLSIQIISILIFLNFIVPGETGAEEPLVPQAITVSSLYWDSILKSWGNEVEWVFSLSGTSPAGNGYTLKAKRKGAETPTVLLRYGREGKLREVTRFLTEHGQMRRIADSFSEKLVLSEGFPVPYDFLAPGDMSLRKVKIKKEAGGAVFSYQVEREIKEFSGEQAVQDGLVKGGVQSLVRGKSFKWIVVKKGGETLVRQLWAEGLPWWVYEETPFRKSWLVEVKM